MLESSSTRTASRALASGLWNSSIGRRMGYTSQHGISKHRLRELHSLDFGSVPLSAHQSDSPPHNRQVDNHYLPKDWLFPDSELSENKLRPGIVAFTCSTSAHLWIAMVDVSAATSRGFLGGLLGAKCWTLCIVIQNSVFDHHLPHVDGVISQSMLVLL